MVTPWEQAQAAVLGSCLIDQKAVPKVLSAVNVGDFDRIHRPVWLAIAAAWRAGETVDPVVISGKLGGDETSRALMLQLMEATPTAANVDAYLDVLREQSQLQQIQAVAMDLASARTVDEARELVGKLTQSMASRQGVTVYSWADLAQRYLDRMQRGEKVQYLSWGLPQLDSALYVRPGSFVILGGYPSEGKTALALQFALAQSKDCRVGIFSLETKPDVLFDRGLAHEAELDLGKVHSGEMSDEERELAMAQLVAAPHRNIFTLQASGLTVQDIQAISVAQGAEVIYIDYVQLIQPDNPRDMRHEQVARISRALHTMAQTTGITVIALSQLSRPDKPQRPKGKVVKGDFVPAPEPEVPEPTMSDLRESGQLEQDADAILLLWRPYPNSSKNTDRRLKLAKNKEGIALKKMLLSFDGPTQTFAYKDPRTLSQRIKDAGKAGRETSWAREAQNLKQMTMTELTEPDPECPF